MTSEEIRKRFLDFFAARGHTVVPSSPLIPDDPSVLLTTAGMQQFKKYYGELDPAVTVHPSLGKPVGKNAASCQKSFRTSDIDEVGDESHLTFFEMLGNFSFGGYFKKEAITYAHDFITKEMGLAIAYVTIFEGSKEAGVPKDEESKAIWKSLGVLDVREEGMDDVFWGPTGDAGPCGPTTEIYCTNAAGENVEIWNVVFNQFFYPGSREELLGGTKEKKLAPLKMPGVDTGMGLERLAMIVQQKGTIFETDLFAPLQDGVAGMAEAGKRVQRILMDHARAIAFLVADGVRPSNKAQGYILRRLVRRAIVHANIKGLGAFASHEEEADGTSVDLTALLRNTVKKYGAVYALDEKMILGVFEEEAGRFGQAFRKGIREMKRLNSIDAKEAFRLYESYGLPFEVVKEFGEGKAGNVTKEDFDAEFRRHQEISRSGSEAKFGGHGLYLKTGEVTIRDASEVEKVTRLHTATHLLHAGLRAVLGPDVRQDGSDITVERTRFDFRFPRKVEPSELKKVETWVNDMVKKNLAVSCEEMSYEHAIKEGALGFFREKYPQHVKVYSMRDPVSGTVYSKELCGGPHVVNTGAVGEFKIAKEESVAAGVRRIRGTVTP